MLNRSQTTTFLQIFYELLLYSHVILKSMRVADDTLEGNSECEWVNLRVPIEVGIWIFDTFDNNFRIKNDFEKYLKEYCL